MLSQDPIFLAINGCCNILSCGNLARGLCLAAFDRLDCKSVGLQVPARKNCRINNHWDKLMLGIIGGSGLYSLESVGQVKRKRVKTAHDERTVPAEIIVHEGGQFVFLPRHGKNHQIAPHEINYRANIVALHKLGVSQIVAVNAVGGITENTRPGAIIVPDQLIDYTWGRASTYAEGEGVEVSHIDFTHPFDEALSQRLLNAVESANTKASQRRVVLAQAVYGVTQGPRLETAAEIKRMQQDGCDIVGMTAMPEAALARELGVDYAMLALSVNWAAGVLPGVISMEEIQAVMRDGQSFLHGVLLRLIKEGAR